MTKEVFKCSFNGEVEEISLTFHEDGKYRLTISSSGYSTMQSFDRNTLERLHKEISKELGSHRNIL